MTDLSLGNPTPDPQEALALLAESLDMTPEDLREQLRDSGLNERLERLDQRVTDDAEEHALDKIAASFGGVAPEPTMDVTPQDVPSTTWYGRVIDGRAVGRTNFYYYKDDTSGVYYPTGCYVDEVPPEGRVAHTEPNYPTRTRTASGTYIPTAVAAPSTLTNTYRPFCPLPEDYVVAIPGTHVPRRLAVAPLCTVVAERLYYITLPDICVWVKVETVGVTTTSFGPAAQTYFLCTGRYAVYDTSETAFVAVGDSDRVNILMGRARALGDHTAGYYPTVAANQYLLCRRLTRLSRSANEEFAVPMFPPLILQKKTEPGADTSEVHVDEAGHTNEGKLWSYDTDT